MTHNWFTRSFLAIALITWAAVTPSTAAADMFFDMSPMPGDFDLTDFDHRGTLTRDGLTASFTAHSDEGLFEILGKLVFTPTNFGISIVDATDQDPALIDAGNSDTFGFVPERMLISFDQAVRLDQITLRYLADGSNARLLNPGDVFDIYADLTGSASEFDTFDLASNSIILAPGQQIGLAYSTGSFSLKSFRVSSVPEPGTGILFALAAACTVLHRRKN